LIACFLASQHEKGKTILDFNEQKKSWGGSGISMTICKSFAPYSGQITMPASQRSIFHRPYAFPDAKPAVHCQSTEGTLNSMNK